jgi:hypothetical protein
LPLVVHKCDGDHDRLNAVNFNSFHAVLNQIPTVDIVLSGFMTTLI